MKLAANQIGGFLQNPPPSVRIVLVFGPDAGLVAERGALLAKKFVADPTDPFCVTLLTGASANESAGRLYDEMAAQAFGGGRRLIRLQQAIEGNASSVAKLVSDLPPGDSVLLIEAGDLDKRSKLRSACETDGPAVCAIPCYVEDAAQRQRTVGDILQAANLRIERPLLNLLADQLPPDRLAMRSEVDKLCLYCHDKKEVSLEDIQATITNAGAAEADELIFLIANGEVKKAEVFLNHLFAEQTSPVSILRAAQRHFLRLQRARAFYDEGMGARESVDRLQPKVFWKFVAAMTQQVQKWKMSRIEGVLEKLFEAEAAVKRTGTPDVALTSQLILQIGAQAI